MTDVADRHWGQSLVRAPTAKDAAHPGAAVVPGVAPFPGSASPRAGPVAAGGGAGPRPRPVVVGVAPASPPVLPELPPMPVLRPPPVAASPSWPATAPVATVVRWPVAEPAVAPPDLPTDPLADQSLARLARGVQDCARALASLADRIDGLERRLDGVDPADDDGAAPHRTGGAGADSIDVRLRALEGMSADRLRGLEQRLRPLETLPTLVGRLQEDLVLRAELGRGRPDDDAGGAELAAVYEELDAVAEVVSAHHGFATQSLERVRTLERAVLEMRRHLERKQAEHARATASDLATATDRIDRLEARVHHAELSSPPARS